MVKGIISNLKGHVLDIVVRLAILVVTAWLALCTTLLFFSIAGFRMSDKPELTIISMLVFDILYTIKIWAEGVFNNSNWRNYFE